MKACLSAIRSALPDGILDNNQLAEEFPSWSAEKIYVNTGIRMRRIAAAGECASDIALRAIKTLIDEVDLDLSKVDYLLYCTQTPDHILPSTACLLQAHLGLPLSCGAIDVALGCSGYVYGLGVVKGLIETGQARNVLFVNADTITKLMNPADRSVRAIFGDAATVTLVCASDREETMIGPFVYGTDGNPRDLVVPAGASRQPKVHNPELIWDDNGNGRTVNDLHMNGVEVFNFSLRVLPSAVQKLLDEAGLDKSDIDLFVFHQANRFMLDQLRRKMQIPVERFVIALENVGNTTSCSIPLALQHTFNDGRLKPGSLVMLVGFGVGYSWAATLIRWADASA